MESTYQISFYKKPHFWMHIQTLAISLIWWNITFLCFMMLYQLLHTSDDSMINMPYIFHVFYQKPIIGTLLISLFAFINTIMETAIVSPFNKNNNFLKRVFFKVISFVGGFCLFYVALNYFYQYHFFTNNINLREFSIALFNDSLLLVLILGGITHISLSVFLKSIRQTGFTMFWKIILGNYRKPKEEHRIFIFLDLVSSTKFSQYLGHKKYSAFLQDCFYTISNSIVNNKGMVYQFVGDEVIITWKGNQLLNHKKAVEFFFQFKHDLAQKNTYFMQTYGILPEFTASLNTGKVMAAEVGVLKIQIAYHGSVLNTAARIQKLCSTYKTPLIATENYIKMMEKIRHNYTCNFLDTVHLKGKESKEAVFTITT